MNESVTISLEMTLNPADADSFCASMVEAFKDTATRPGFIGIRFARSSEEPNKFILIEVWRTQQAYDDYISWRAGRGEGDGIAKMMAAPPRLTFWPTLIVAI